MTALTLRPGDINLNDARIFQDNEAHDVLRMLRRESPVHWNPGDERWQGFWSITRDEDILQGIASPGTVYIEQGHRRPLPPARSHRRHGF